MKNKLIELNQRLDKLKNVVWSPGNHSTSNVSDDDDELIVHGHQIEESNINHHDALAYNVYLDANVVNCITVYLKGGDTSIVRFIADQRPNSVVVGVHAYSFVNDKIDVVAVEIGARVPTFEPVTRIAKHGGTQMTPKEVPRSLSFKNHFCVIPLNVFACKGEESFLISHPGITLKYYPRRFLKVTLVRFSVPLIHDFINYVFTNTIDDEARRMRPNVTNDNRVYDVYDANVIPMVIRIGNLDLHLFWEESEPNNYNHANNFIITISKGILKIIHIDESLDVAAEDVKAFCNRSNLTLDMSTKRKLIKPQFITQHGRLFVARNGTVKPNNSNNNLSYNSEATAENHLTLICSVRKHFVNASYSVETSSVKPVARMRNTFWFVDSDFSITREYARAKLDTRMDGVTVVRWSDNVPLCTGTVMPSISSHSHPEWSWRRSVKLVITLRNARVLNITKHQKGMHAEIVLLPGVAYLQKLKQHPGDSRRPNYQVAYCDYFTPFYLAIGSKVPGGTTHVAMSYDRNNALSALIDDAQMPRVEFEVGPTGRAPVMQRTTSLQIDGAGDGTPRRLRHRSTIT